MREADVLSEACEHTLFCWWHALAAQGVATAVSRVGDDVPVPPDWWDLMRNISRCEHIAEWAGKEQFQIARREPIAWQQWRERHT